MVTDDEKQVLIPGHGPVDTAIKVGDFRECLKDLPDSWSISFLAIPKAHLVVLDEEMGRRGIIDLQTKEVTLWEKAI
jgi:hypothetical protein